MLVTVFSDAGLCPHMRLGTWGGWVKSVRGTARGGGVLKDAMFSTTVAESRALLNTIHMGLKAGVIQPGDTIVAQTDNDAVGVAIAGAKTKKGGHKQPDRVETARVAQEFLARHNLTLEWRHVKGHSGGGDPRSKVNGYCDRVARYFLRAERAKRDPRHHRPPGKPPYGVAAPCFRPAQATHVDAASTQRNTP